MTKDHKANATEFRNWCRACLQTHHDTALHDPLASGVRMLMIDLWDRLADGKSDREDLSKLAKLISDDGLAARAKRLADRSDFRDWSVVVRDAFSTLPRDNINAVCAVLGQTRAGIVFTAHPTFALSRKLRAAAGAMVDGKDADLSGIPHAPDAPLTLQAEHDDVLQAISRAQRAIRRLLEAVFDWAAETYPQDWASIRPAPFSLATWVGYDLDGRTDIHWAETFRIRLEEKSLQLNRYVEALNGIGAASDIASELSVAGQEAAEQSRLFSVDLDDPENIVRAANRLTEKHPGRMTSLEGVKSRLEALIAETDDIAIKKTLLVLLAEMTAYGLGVARIHLRVNAAQVRSALRTDLGLEDGRAFNERTALDAAAGVAAKAKKRNINFASVFQEQMTARRQFMLCAQFLKHVDSDTPIRFLIAEIEAPATIMGAIYLARLYGVNENVDISPLFETPDAIERGGRFIERLLEEAEFVDYVNRRGRLSIQCGFSDSGRFMGQIAADFAIERLHILTARALAQKGLRDIEVVIFNTHGESMGRGALPENFEKRLDYLMTPWTRARYAHERLRLNTECSFQGGDGFLHFETDSLATRTMQTIFSWSRREPIQPDDDRFYSDLNFSWDVYRAIKNFQEDLFDDPNYQAALGNFAPNLLPVTGSRKTRRQSGTSKNDAARSLRAIPHNAILQQLAAPANVFGGMGTSAVHEPERFKALIETSARMKQAFAMAENARRLTSLSVLRTYASLYDPSFWVVRSARSLIEADRRAPLAVAGQLSKRSLDTALGRLANRLSVDRQKFDLAAHELGREQCGDLPFSEDLYILHAIRMTLMAHGFVLTASTPPFSARHELSHEALIDLALDLNFEEVAAAIEEIFPESDNAPAAFEALSERMSDTERRGGGYEQLWREIASPLREIDRSIKEITVSISHYYDAFG